MEFFWGARVTQAEDYVADVGNAAVHITQACLDPESKGSATLFAKTLRFQDAFPLCTLRAGQVDHCNLDHTFYPGDEKVQFTVRGKAAVCITGVQVLSEDAESGEEDEDEDEEISTGEEGEEEDDEEDDEEALRTAARDLRAKANQAEGKPAKGKPAKRARQEAAKAEPAAEPEGKKARKAAAAGSAEEAAAGAGKKKQEAKKEKAAEPAVEKKKGIHLVDLKPGKGAVARRNSRVSVRYSGKLTNGKKFDAGTIKFRLGAGEVIEGWDIGVEGMRTGGKRRLLVPPGKAYGAAGAPPTIPPNATLIFEVELLKA